MVQLGSPKLVWLPSILYCNAIVVQDISLVAFMHPVFITCQVELSSATRVSVLVCLFNWRQLFVSNCFPLFVDSIVIQSQQFNAVALPSICCCYLCCKIVICFIDCMNEWVCFHMASYFNVVDIVNLTFTLDVLF